MIRYIGPGVVVNAIMQAGFRNGYNDFDVAHFSKLDPATGKIIRLVATYENVDNAHPAELGPVDNTAVLPLLDGALPPLLVHVAQELMHVNCKVQLLDAGSRHDGSLVLFERLDMTQCMNRLMGTRVKVYGRCEPAPGHTADRATETADHARIVDSTPFTISGER